MARRKQKLAQELQKQSAAQLSVDELIAQVAAKIPESFTPHTPDPVQPKTTARGPLGAPYLFVLSHVPSDGMAAWLLQTMLDCGIRKTDCRFVFMLDEPPQGSSNKPTKDQLRKAWPRFSKEIADSTPKVVVPLGSDALYALTGIREHINDSRGYVIKNQFFRPAVHDEYVQIGVYKGKSKATGALPGDPKMAWRAITAPGLLGADFTGVIIPLFQLDYIRKSGFAITAAVKADLLRASRAQNHALALIDEGFTYAPTLHNGVYGHSWGEIVAVDIETHGVDNEVIDRVSFSDGAVTASVPWDRAALDFVSHLFNLPDRIFALHNSQFDIPRLLKAGVKITETVQRRQLFDTMFAGVTVQPDLLKGLGRMAPVYLDTFPWKWESIAGADPERYSAKDAYVTAWLAIHLIRIMKDLGTWNLFMGRGGHPGPGVMATLPVLTAMTEGGIKINKYYAGVWCRRLQHHLLRLLKLWYRKFPAVSPSSVRDLRTLFYTHWDLPFQKGLGDNLSTDELACMRLREFTRMFAGSTDYATAGWRKDPNFSPRVFDLLLAIRETSKNLGTYALPVKESQDAYVHPQYMPVAKDDDTATRGNTATGRLAAYNPGIQQQPKIARGLYVPDSPEHCFISADYTRAEPYVMAYSANDKNLIGDLESGDLYQALLDRLTGMGYKGLKRKTCKNVYLAGQYLAGAPKVSEMILKQDHVFIDIETCKSILYGIASVYSDVAAYKRHLVGLCESQKYVRNAFGRVRIFYDGRGPAAVDFIPQSTVADIIWCILHPVHGIAKKYGGRLTTTVHDQVLVQVLKQFVPQAVAEIKQVMEQTFDCVAKGFRVPVEFEVGEPGASWGNLKPYVLAA